VNWFALLFKKYMVILGKNVSISHYIVLSKAPMFSLLGFLVGRALPQSEKSLWFKPWSGQVNDWKIGTYCLPGYSVHI